MKLKQMFFSGFSVIILKILFRVFYIPNHYGFVKNSPRCPWAGLCKGVMCVVSSVDCRRQRQRPARLTSWRPTGRAQTTTACQTVMCLRWSDYETRLRINSSTSRPGLAVTGDNLMTFWFSVIAKLILGDGIPSQGRSSSAPPYRAARASSWWRKRQREPPVGLWSWFSVLGLRAEGCPRHV